MIHVRFDDFFFFSSRRRHTRCSRDWSSDVCSSDLLIRSQVKRHSGDFFRLPNALERRALFVLLAPRVILPKILTEISLNETGGNGIDTNIVRTKFLGPGTSHHQQAGFGKTVKQSAGLRSQTGNRSDVDDRPATLALDHFGYDQPEQAQRRLD